MGMKHKPTKKMVERFVLTLAYFNEVHPDSNPAINEWWAKIRKNHDRDCLKYGECEICGKTGLLGEYGLNWVCIDNRKCHKAMEKWYDKMIREQRCL